LKSEKDAVLYVTDGISFYAGFPLFSLCVLRAGFYEERHPDISASLLFFAAETLKE